MRWESGFFTYILIRIRMKHGQSQFSFCLFLCSTFWQTEVVGHRSLIHPSNINISHKILGMFPNYVFLKATVAS